uniref:Coiled-coil domain-containing protein 167 n=1 Tax=Rhipicephalus microplus TaxID=6941 RepID=A0A6G5AET4_RHIMP
MPDNSRISVLKEIDRNEALVQDYLYQLDQIESKLRRSVLSDSEREKLEDEVKSLKSQLDTLEQELTGLRKENRKSMAIAACLFILFLLIYYFLIIKQ